MSGSKNGGNSLGTTSDTGNAIVFYIEAQWNETSASQLIQEAVGKVIKHANCIAAEKGLKRDLIYLNYANAKQNPLASYGRENLESLREVAKKYDPRGIFQTQVPGGIKASRA